MKTYRSLINEIGFDGRSVRNLDPMQMMTKGVAVGDADLKKITKGMRDGAKQKLIGDLQKLVDGDRPDWWPKSQKLNKKQIANLEKQLKNI